MRVGRKLVCVVTTHRAVAAGYWLGDLAGVADDGCGKCASICCIAAKSLYEHSNVF